MKKLIALLLALAMVTCLFAGCKSSGDTPLVVGYSPFSSKFSPFFSETAYDQDVYAMTQIGLLTSDRTGAIILKGIEGETIEYNGTPYTYYGPANLTITENADGTVYYDFELRDDITFSDGEKLTIDDVIFSMYVLCDPTYDGNSTLYAQPILGMEEYRGGMDTLFNLMVAAGPDNTDFTYWDEATQTAFWAELNEAGASLAKDICDYCLGYADDYAAVLGDDVTGDAIRADEALQLQFGMAMWGYGDAWFEGATTADYWDAIVAAYDGDIATAVAVEGVNQSMGDLTGHMPNYTDYTVGIQTGESAPNIAGIQKTGDYSMRVVLTKVDAVAIYQLGISIAPMHYYGDASLYDYDNNSFGFPKGDLSSVRAKTTQPMGAGPYKFIKFENGVVNFEANEDYYLGAPKTKYVNFLETLSDDDKLNGVVTGTIDITDPSMSVDTAKTITDKNGGEGLTGKVITTDLVNNLGYGYIGMNANVMNVGGDPASDASKNLRKAFGTVFSVYRDTAIDSYYGELASVINYPISDTSWAAPRPSDEGYKIAFSTAVDGSDIYTSDMTTEEKYAAASQAALGYLEAAGYTVADGKVTAAPEGASLEYELWIPADGTGNHPSFMICTLARDAFAELGINLIIKDLTNSSDLWTALEAGEVAMWCAAWGASVDPDMYQIYYSDVANAGTATEGQNQAGGANQGGSNYMYCIADAELDQLIMDARASTDQTYRKAMYKSCLDIVIDWAVEIPVYQRQNAIIFSSERVDMSTVTPDITTFYGWMSEIENIELNAN
ncbi:MAG: ABC transporter substrate-binding protein [Faecousia sp.]